MMWEKVRLGDISKPVTGKTPPTGETEYFDGGITWVNPSDFGTKYIEESKRTVSIKAVNDKKCNVLPSGTILLSCIGDIGKVGILKEQGTTNQQITGLILGEKVFPEYLYYFLILNKSKLENLANKAVVAILNNERLKELQILLPPLPIQKRIAEILDTADALRRKDEALLKKYDELAQAIFIDMFGDPVKNEKGWEVKKLGEVCDKITDGTHQSPTFTKEGVPFLFVSNIVNNQIVYETEKFISFDEFEILNKRTPIEIGNIIITTVGSYGNPAIINSTKPFAFQRHIAFLKPNHKLINYNYLFGFLKSPNARYQIERKVNGIAQKTLNLGDLKNLDIWMPPIQVQEKYSTLLKKLKEIHVLNDNCHSANLFNSLLQKAFNGELVK